MHTIPYLLICMACFPLEDGFSTGNKNHVKHENHLCHRRLALEDQDILNLHPSTVTTFIIIFWSRNLFIYTVICYCYCVGLVDPKDIFVLQPVGKLHFFWFPLGFTKIFVDRRKSWASFAALLSSDKGRRWREPPKPLGKKTNVEVFNDRAGVSKQIHTMCIASLDPKSIQIYNQGTKMLTP